MLGCGTFARRYHALDPSHTLRACLAGTHVIEFPTIIVELQASCDVTQYPLVEAGARAALIDGEGLVSGNEENDDEDVCF